jgi:kynurenine formamidase
MHLIDLSQTISPDMPMFSDRWPRPTIGPWMSHSQSAFSGSYEGCTVEISQVGFITSIGTYLDSPFHFDPNGQSIERLNLEQLVLPGLKVVCQGIQARQPIEPDCFAGLDLGGRAVLFQTGWSHYWGQAEYLEAPFLTENSARALLDGGAAMVGVDFLVADDMHNPRRPVHNLLLQQRVLIVENLTNLQALPVEDFIFHAVPARISGAASFPVRAYAIVDDG